VDENEPAWLYVCVVIELSPLLDPFRTRVIIIIYIFLFDFFYFFSYDYWVSGRHATLFFSPFISFTEEQNKDEPIFFFCSKVIHVHDLASKAVCESHAVFVSVFR